METFKLAKRDIVLGVRKKMRYPVFVIVCLIGCMNFSGLMEDGLELFGKSNPSMANCFAFIFQGIEPMIRKNTMSEFVIPPVWLMLMLLYLLMPLDYPIKSMEVWGSQYLIRTSRRSWWNAKCIYTIVINILTFLLQIMIIFLFCLIKQMPISMHNNQKFYEALYGGNGVHSSLEISVWGNILLLIVLPLLGIVAMSMFQLFVAVWINPYIAYLLSIGILVCSVLLDSPILLANHTMTIRSALVCENGIGIGEAILWCIGIMALVWIMGVLFVKKKDMLVLKKEDV